MFRKLFIYEKTERFIYGNAYIGNIKTMDKKIARAKGESDIGKEKKQIHCSAYMDTMGRILIPLRNRKEAGIAGIRGADCEVDLVVRKVYEKKEE